MIRSTPDTANFNSTKQGDGDAALGVNSGLLARHNLFGTDGHSSCEFTGPLLADICNQDHLILDNVDIDINLWPTKDEFRILTSPYTLNCKLTVEEIYLNVCKVPVNEYCMSGHKAGLEISKGKYPMQKTVMLTKILLKGSFGEPFEDIFQGLVPTKMVIGMVVLKHTVEILKKFPCNFNLLILNL